MIKCAAETSWWTASMLYTFTSYVTFYQLYIDLLKTAIAAAVTLSLLISFDRLYRVAKYLRICVRVWLTGRKPEDEFGARPLPHPTHHSSAYPKVAVQLPMFNERAVCQAAIDSAAELVWPRNRFCVQVRDFSARWPVWLKRSGVLSRHQWVMECDARLGGWRRVAVKGA